MAVPFFVSLMWLEFVFSKKQKKSLFNFEEVVANLNVGIAERICDVFTSVLFYYFYF